MKKTMKKLLCLVMTVLMCVAYLPMVSFAAENTDIYVDISAQKEIMRALDDLEIKVAAAKTKADVSAIYDYLDVTVKCLDAKGNTYEQIIDVSETAEDIVTVSFPSADSIKKVSLFFNAIDSISTKIIGIKLKLVESEYMPSFAVSSKDFGDRIFESHEATVLENITADIPLKVLGVSCQGKAEMRTAEYSLDIHNENITVDISSQLAIIDAFEEIRIDMAGTDVKPDFSNFYDYMDVDVELKDADGNIYIKTIDVSEATEALVELSFPMTAPVESVALRFNCLKEVIAKIISIETSLFKTDFVQSFSVSSSTFGSKVFTEEQIETGEDFEGSFILSLSMINVSAFAKMQKAQYTLDLYREDVTIDISAPRAIMNELDNAQVDVVGSSLKLDFSDFYDYLDVTVECIDANGNITSQIIDVSEAESDRVSLNFSTTAPVSRINLNFYGIKNMKTSAMGSTINLIDNDYIQEFVIDSSSLGSRYFSEENATIGEEITESFKLKAGIITLDVNAILAPAQYTYNFCEETVSINIAEYREFWKTLENIKVSVGTLNLSDLSEKADDIAVICTDINGNTQTQVIETYEAQDDIATLTFSMDAPIKKMQLQFKIIKKLTVMGINMTTNEYINRLIVDTRTGSRLFAAENAELKDTDSVKFNMKFMGVSVKVNADVQNAEYVYDFGGEIFSEGYSFETDRYSFANIKDSVSEDIYKKAYGEVKGAALYNLYEKGEMHGLCYGMTGTSAALLAHDDALASFNTQSGKMNELTDSSVSDLFGTDLGTYIKYGYIYQFDSDVQSAEQASENNITGLYDAVKAYVDGNNRPVIINIFSKDGENLAKGHSVLAVGLKETADYYTLLINDSDINFEKQELRIAKDYSSWSYNRYNSDNADFTYSLPADKLYSVGKMINTSTGFFGSEESLVTSSQSIDEVSGLQKILPAIGSSEDENDGIHAYWLDDEEDAEITSIADNNTVTVSADKSSVEFVLDKDDEAKVNVDVFDNTSVIIKTAADESRKITFNTVADNGEVTTVEIEAEADGDTVKATRKDNAISLSGVKDGSITLSQGDEIISSQNFNMAESDVEISYGDDKELDVDYVSHEHSYESKVTKEPTHLEIGEKTFVCQCGDSYTEEMAKIKAHSYEAETIEATCTQEGCIVYTCECGESYTESVSAKGHTYKDGETKCTDCGEEKPFNCSCNCHKSGIISLIWKIINLFNRIFKINRNCGCGVAHW